MLNPATLVRALVLLVPAFAGMAAQPQTPPAVAPRAAVLTLGGEPGSDEVGLHITAKSLHDCIPLLEQEKVDVVVLRFRSTAGSLDEVPRLSDVLHDEYKLKFRLVAWIDQALDAGAMVAHTNEEFIFTPAATYGACVATEGERLSAVKGPRLEKLLIMMEKISARGLHPLALMRAMQLSSDAEECRQLQAQPPWGALSYTIRDDDVRFYQDDTTGKVVLNPRNGVHVLTLDAEDAKAIRFSKGTASTLKEVETILGIPGATWVGEKVKGVDWPVCKAERALIDQRERATTAKRDLRGWIADAEKAVAGAEAAKGPDRVAQVASARAALERITGLVDGNGQFAAVFWGSEQSYATFRDGLRDRLAALAEKKPEPAR